jgi:hypothetical protein
MKAPPFTRENARDMQRKAVESRRLREEAKNNLLAQFSAITPDQTRVAITKAQLDAIDMRLNNAIAKGNLLVVDMLADIKKKLWPLVQPTQGAVKSRQSRQPTASVEPLTPQ